ncbi:MAG: HmuY family protein [Deltaproteobacteria bacterium]|nr:HmuY family protein [Deltaproteobacteria bacterium]
MSLRALALLPLLAACGEEKDTTDTSVNTPDPVCTEQTEVGCVDDLILDLSLHDDKVSDDLVATSSVDGVFVTTVDATAGGMNAASSNPWVYVKFTQEGAVRVDIDDETALESMDWDLAARRYIIRVNGGSSGPSCVAAAALPGETFGAVTTPVSDSLPWQSDAFYNSECAMLEDGSGLPGSFPTALGAWWGYVSCVETTLTPFYLRLADGKTIELLIEAYYEEGQGGCNSSGNPGSNGGMFTWRWQWVEA